MSIKKTALGRGLSAILPSDLHGDDRHEAVDRRTERQREERLHLVGRISEIDVQTVRPNPYQPRRDFDENALEELAASILQLGVIQPITVRAVEDGFEIISGERRLRAARRAGLKRLPAFVREADSEAMLEMAIVENVQREDLNPIELALGFQRLVDECGLTQEEIARKVGKNRATIANFLRLLKLPPRIQASLRDGRAAMGHARALINVEDEKVQHRLIVMIEEQDLSVREVEEAVRRWRESLDRSADAEHDSPVRSSTPDVPDRDALQIRAFTARLRSRLSTQVKIRHGRNAGRIEIEYYSNDDLERLLELILAE